MKKLLTLVVVMVAWYNCFAIYTVSQRQNAWRWRNNDGTQTSASWKAPANTPVALNSNNEVLRLRTEVVVTRSCNNLNPPFNCTGGPTTITQRDSLQYTTNTALATSWKNIGTDGTKDFRLTESNSYVYQNDPTTPQINSSTSAFTAGKIMVTDSVANNLTFSFDRRSEFEWVFAPTANLLPGTTYYFRQRGSTTAYLFAAPYATLTTLPPLPIKLSSFTVKNEGKKAKLKWTTASEHNNDRFEVQRSNDQRTWQTVATIKGRGSTTAATTYATDDDNPLKGTSYYRLQQFDLDGKFTFSGIQLLKMTEGNDLAVSVWPNPTANNIYFSLGSAGKVEAVLSSAGGKIIHREVFTNVQAGTTNKLHLQAKPAPGIYLLQLTAGGLSENLKVVIQ